MSTPTSKTLNPDLASVTDWEKKTAAQKLEYIRSNPVKLPKTDVFLKDIYDRGARLNNILLLWIQTAIQIKKQVASRYKPGDKIFQLCAAFIAATDEGILTFANKIAKDIRNIRDYGQFFAEAIPLNVPENDVTMKELEDNLDKKTNAQGYFDVVKKVIDIILATYPGLNEVTNPTKNFFSWGAALNAALEAGNAFFTEYAKIDNPKALPPPQHDSEPEPATGGTPLAKPASVLGMIQARASLSSDVQAGLKLNLESNASTEGMPEFGKVIRVQDDSDD